MPQPVKRILLILIAVFVLPLVLFVVYQISRLDKDEQMISQIYNGQLEAILSSVNQYSNDIVDSWVSKIGIAINETPGAPNFERIYDENEAINYIYLSNKLDETGRLAGTFSDGQQDSLITKIRNLLLTNEPEIGRLETYLKGGYRKVQPLGALQVQGRNLNALTFLVDYKGSQQICCLLVDPLIFLQRTLYQKIQTVSQEEFIISAYNDDTDQQISLIDSIAASQKPLRKELWLLPDYSLGIVLQGQTIQALANDRTQTNLLIVGVVGVILIFGLWLVYRNITKAMALAQIKSDFVSNVSHEIRTPLSLITMFAETLQMNRVKTQEKKQEYYRIISQEANRLRGIVNKILSFSKMEAGKISYSLEKSNLNEVVEEVLKSYSFHLKNKQFEYTFKACSELLEIQGDKDALSEAIINLIDNAIKYSNGEKLIELYTGVESGYAYFEVVDHGIGISGMDQKNVFDKFYRVPSGAVHNTKGTGLGLTLVKHIVEAHGGQIELVSKLNEGSSFRLKFPLTKHSLIHS